jgi:hypothetical protein
VQITGLPPKQTPFWQVSVWVHALPSLHAVPLGFPAHCASPAWQTPFRQIPLWQSLFTKQVLPFAQGGQTGPPQSTSVSLPFLIPSLQVAMAVAEQVPFTQVAPEKHVLPGQHGEPAAPHCVQTPVLPQTRPLPQVLLMQQAWPAPPQLLPHTPLPPQPRPWLQELPPQHTSPGAPQDVQIPFEQTWP